MIFFNPVESMISDLESKIPWDRTGLFYPGKLERSDWRPIWDLCKRIQEEFKSGNAFSAREVQNAAWARFAAARKKASDLADREKDVFADQSRRIRNDILDNVKSCRYSKMADILFFFDPTTVEEIKAMSRRLKEAGQRLSESKQWMLAEHKKECFEAILEARSSIDEFWAQRRQLSAERREATARKQQEFEERQAIWRERVHQNIRKNKGALEKALDALSRTQSRITELEDKLSNTTSGKWEAIFSEWLSEARAKEQNIEESVDRIRGWIDEDQAKLNS